MLLCGQWLYIRPFEASLYSSGFPLFLNRKKRFVMGDKIFVNVVKFVEKELKYIDEDDVGRAVQHMNDSYFDLDSSAAAELQLHFRRRIYRCGYVYRYMTCFASVAKQCLNQLNVDNFFQTWVDDRHVINITSIGGGPGTDLLTFYLFLQQIDVDVEMKGVVLDVCTEWLNCAQYLFKYYDVWNLYKLSDVEYISFDIFDKPLNEDILDGIRQSDIISIVKFVSSTSYKREFCEEQLTDLLSTLKQNSLVFFMDNSGGRYLELMMNVATASELILISQFEHQNMTVPDSELKEIDRCEYLDVWTQPMKSCKVSAAIWRKRGGRK